MPDVKKTLLTEDMLRTLSKENIVYMTEYTRKTYKDKDLLSDGYPLKDSLVTYIKIKKEEIKTEGGTSDE